MDNKVNILNKIYYKEENPYIIFILPFTICFIVLIITIYYLIKIDSTGSNILWENNKCLPKYLFVSGFIQRDKDKGMLDTTYTNFKKCIKKYSKKDN